MDVTQRGKERKKAKNRKQSLRRGQGWGLETKKTRASEALKEVLPLGIPPSPTTVLTRVGEPRPGERKRSEFRPDT